MHRLLCGGLLAVAAGCGPTSTSTLPPLPPDLTVTPTALTFRPVVVGEEAVALAQVTNQGGEALALTAETQTPFSVSPHSFDLPQGQTVEVTVRFSAQDAGAFAGLLDLAGVQVTLVAEAYSLTPRPTPNSCTARQGSNKVNPATGDGRPCHAVCVVDGTCSQGVCVGRPAPDDTPCGQDDCLSDLVSVCLAGACVPRARPPGGPCSNRWIPLNVPQRSEHAMAWDGVNDMVMLFGGLSASGNDTWEWNRAHWVRRWPANAPPPRNGHAMSWDRARGEVVLFGGTATPGGLLGDTWVWDGADWTQRAPGLSPSPRLGAALAANPSTGRVYLFGGTDGTGELGDTWVWDGAEWALTGWVGPSPRSYAGLAYDATLGRMLLFGGGDNFNSQSDTWSLGPQGWVQEPTPVAPDPGRGAALVFEANQRKVLLLRQQQYAFEGAAWEWDGASWTQTQGLQPDPRWGLAVAWDEGSGEAVMTGGISAGPNPTDAALGDTFLFDGQQWRVLSNDRPTPGTNEVSLAWDSSRQVLVLFNGQTWEWAGQHWLQRSPQDSPRASDGAMAYDEARHRVVYVRGGYDQSPVNAARETWEWDGVNWLSRQLPVQPLGRHYGAMAYDRARQRVVLFGGQNITQPSWELGDTWEYDGTTWTQTAVGQGPGPIGYPHLAYDDDRQQVVLYRSDFTSASTWYYDATGWTQLLPSPTPGWLTRGSLVYDPNRHTLVMLGGLVAGQNSTSSMWELSQQSSGWYERVAGPGWPYLPALGAYDLLSRHLLAFDGTLWAFVP